MNAEVLLQKPKAITGWPLMVAPVHFLKVIFDQLGRVFAW